MTGPNVPLELLKEEAPKISKRSAYDSGKVSNTHRAPLPSRRHP